MSFIDSRFPSQIAFGSSFGTRRNTRNATTPSGFRQAQSLQAGSLREYDFASGLKDADTLQAFLRHFEVMQARLHSFPVLDHGDNLSCDPSGTISNLDVDIGTADGMTTDFQLVKPFTLAGNTVTRKVYLPIVATVVVAVGGVDQPSGWTVSRPGGVVSFDVAPGGSPAPLVTAGFQYEVECYYDMDRLPKSISTKTANEQFAGTIDSLVMREQRR